MVQVCNGRASVLRSIGLSKAYCMHGANLVQHRDLALYPMHMGGVSVHHGAIPIGASTLRRETELEGGGNFELPISVLCIYNGVFMCANGRPERKGKARQTHVE